MPHKLNPNEIPALNFVPMPEMKDEVVLMGVSPSLGPVFVFTKENTVAAVPWAEIAEYAKAHMNDPEKPKEIGELKRG